MAEANYFDRYDHLRFGQSAPPTPPQSPPVDSFADRFSGAASDADAEPNYFDKYDHLRFGAPGKGGSNWDIAVQVPVGFNEGLANVAGAPVDAATWLWNQGVRGANAAYRGVHGGDEDLIPPIRRPFGGSESIKSGLGLVGLNPEDIPARTSGERIARGVGGGVAAAVAPEAVLATTAKAIPAAVPIAETGARLFGRTAGAGDLATNIAAGAAAGAGGAGAAELAPDQYKPLAHAVGSMAAGVPVAAAPMVAREAVRVGRNFVAPMHEAGREEMAGGRLANAANDVSAVREAIDTAPRELVSGSRPTTFQLTGDTGLGALERDVQTRNPAEFAERRGEQNAARVQALQGVQPTGAPEEVSGFLRGRLAEIDQASQRLIDDVTNRAQGATARLGGQGNPEEYGARLRTALQDAEDTARAGERGLWNAVDPDGRLSVSMGPVRNAERSIYGDMTAAGEAGVTPLESTIRKVIDTYRPVEPFRELADLRSAVSTAMRSEMRSAGRSPAYARLAQLRGAVENAIAGTVEQRAAQDARAVAAGQLNPEQTMLAQLTRQRDAWYADRAVSAGMGASTGNSAPTNASVRSSRVSAIPRTEGQSELEFRGAAGNPGIQETATPTFDQAARERLNAATAATRDRARAFNQGVVGQILRTRGDRGNFQMTDAAVPGNIFRPGPLGYEAVQAFRRAIGNDDQALGALQDAAAASARRYAQRPDGTIDAAKLQRWRNMHADALRTLPEDVTREFADAGRAATAIDAAAQARRTALDAYQQGAIGRLIGVNDPADVVKTVGGIFSRNDATASMQRLTQEVARDPDARDGLRKAVIDYMYGRFVSNTEAATTRVGQMKSDTFQGFVRQNRAALRQVFSEAEVNALSAIAADLQRASRSLTAVRIPGQSNTAQDTIAALEKKPEGHGSLLTQAILAGAAGYEVHGMKGAALGLAGAFGKYFTHKLREAGMEKVEDLVKQAMLDPDTARHLLSRAPPNSPASSAAKMKLAQRLARLSVFEQAENKGGDSRP